jgi:hypothetical protein
MPDFAANAFTRPMGGLGFNPAGSDAAKAVWLQTSVEYIGKSIAS